MESQRRDLQVSEHVKWDRGKANPSQLKSILSLTLVHKPQMASWGCPVVASRNLNCSIDESLAVGPWLPLGGGHDLSAISKTGSSNPPKVPPKEDMSLWVAGGMRILHERGLGRKHLPLLQSPSEAKASGWSLLATDFSSVDKKLKRRYE